MVLSDFIRRWFCRAGFLVLCVLPTCYVLGYGAWVRTPAHRSSVERELSAQLGLGVMAGNTRHPRPGIVLLEDVSIVDPETDDILARARLLEIGEAGNPRLMIATQLQVNGARLDAVAALAERAVRGPRSARESVRLVAPGAVVWRGRATVALPQFRADVTRSADGASLTARWGRKTPNDEAVPFRLTRSRRTKPAATTLELQTAESAMPCWLLAAFWPVAARFGPDASFSGTLWAAHDGEFSRGELSGRLERVRLELLAKGLSSHQIEGAATIAIERARYVDGRLESAVGRIDSESGQVSTSLLALCKRWLQCSTAADVNGPEALVPYDQLALGFSLDRSGVVLHGECAGLGGAILVYKPATLLAEPTQSLQPLANLVRALSAPATATLPATLEAQRLARALPLPATRR